jgi:hypothetical protein
MAQLPPFRRLSNSDIDGFSGESKSNMSKIIYLINSFFENMFSALNNGINFKDNFEAQLQNISFTTGATYTTKGLIAPITFNKNTKLVPNRAYGLIICQITQTTTSNYVPITNPVTLDWIDLGTGTIQINNVTGLNNSTSYSMNIIVF